MKLSEILTGPETWCQEYQARGSRQGCLVWAVDQLFPLNGKSLHNVRELKRLHRVIFGHEAAPGHGIGIHIGQWNDVPGRTWEEVAAVVDAYDRDRLLNP